jgi:hypothetical protein
VVAREPVGAARGGLAASVPEIQSRMDWRNISLNKKLLVGFWWMLLRIRRERDVGRGKIEEEKQGESTQT